jgi:hypothetical protein
MGATEALVGFGRVEDPLEFAEGIGRLARAVLPAALPGG